MLLIVKACMCACACVCAHIRVRCAMYVGFSVGAYVCVACLCVHVYKCTNAQSHLPPKNRESGEENTNHTNHRTRCCPRNSEQVDLGELVREESLESQGRDPREGRMTRPLHSSVAEGSPISLPGFHACSFNQEGFLRKSYRHGYL